MIDVHDTNICNFRSYRLNLASLKEKVYHINIHTHTQNIQMFNKHVYLVCFTFKSKLWELAGMYRCHKDENYCCIANQ